MKVALITGASGGIGRGAAVRLAKAGWNVLAQGRREDALAETLDAVRSAGGKGESFVAEMAHMSDVAALAEWASYSGRLDAVIHCAAKFTYGPVSTDRFDDWDLDIERVLRATIRLTAHTLPAIVSAEGAYVFICGPTSWNGWKKHAIHCALRHAQAGFARAFRGRSRAGRGRDSGSPRLRKHAPRQDRRPRPFPHDPSRGYRGNDRHRADATEERMCHRVDHAPAAFSLSLARRPVNLCRKIAITETTGLR